MARMIDTDKAAETLLDAIRRETDERVAALEARGEEQLRGLAAEHAGAVQALMASHAAAAAERESREILKMENRAALDGQKLRLRIVEEFIEHMTDKAVERFRHERTQEYGGLLARSVAAAAARIGGGAVIVRLLPEDAQRHGAALCRAAAPCRAELSPDSGIRLGGCIVEDRQTGILYVATIEQSIERLSGRIRSEALHLIHEAGHDRFSAAGAAKGQA